MEEQGLTVEEGAELIAQELCGQGQERRDSSHRRTCRREMRRLVAFRVNPRLQEDVACQAHCSFC